MRFFYIFIKFRFSNIIYFVWFCNPAFTSAEFFIFWELVTVLVRGKKIIINMLLHWYKFRVKHEISIVFFMQSGLNKTSPVYSSLSCIKNYLQIFFYCTFLNLRKWSFWQIFISKFKFNYYWIVVGISLLNTIALLTTAFELFIKILSLSVALLDPEIRVALLYARN